MNNIEQTQALMDGKPFNITDDQILEVLMNGKITLFNKHVYVVSFDPLGTPDQFRIETNLGTISCDEAGLRLINFI